MVMQQVRGVISEHHQDLTRGKVSSAEGGLSPAEGGGRVSSRSDSSRWYLNKMTDRLPGRDSQE